VQLTLLISRTMSQEYPTAISEETVTNGATASVTAAPPTTRTLAKKPNYSSQIWDFFSDEGQTQVPASALCTRGSSINGINCHKRMLTLNP